MACDELEGARLFETLKPLARRLFTIAFYAAIATILNIATLDIWAVSGSATCHVRVYFMKVDVENGRRGGACCIVGSKPFDISPCLAM